MTQTKRKLGKQILSFILVLSMMVSGVPMTVFAETGEGNLCEHHTEHTPECGYVEAVEGHPCTHEHTDDCYSIVNCVHEHEESCGEDGESCTHICSMDEGCYALVCSHAIEGQHDDTCGYVDAVEGSPCKYECGEEHGEEVTENSTEGENTAEVTESSTEGENTEEVIESNTEEESTETSAPVYTAEDVKAMLNVLPSASELETMSEDELNSVYEQAQEASDAYEMLTEEQQTELSSEYAKLKEVLEYMAGLTATVGVTAYDKDTKISVIISDLVYSDSDLNKEWELSSSSWAFSTKSFEKVSDGEYKFTYRAALAAGNFDTGSTGTVWTDWKSVVFSDVPCNSDYSKTIAQEYVAANGHEKHTYNLVITRSGRYGHLYGDWADNGDGTHSRVCKINSAHVDTADHNWSDATCSSPQTCIQCGVKQDSVINPENHKWGNWESNGDGTHTRICTLNQEHTETKDCSGGTATCTSGAICSDCKGEYGSTNPDNHDWGEWKSNGDGTHTRTCTWNEKHTETKDCSGGTATCTSGAICSDCKGEYGSTNPDNHKWGNWKSNGDGTHTRSCIWNEEHKETERCSGGTVTCISGPICTSCGTVYGEKDSSNHMFDKGVCKYCSYQCPHAGPSDFTNGVCNKCNYQCPHTNMADGVCPLCGMSGSIGYLFKEWKDGKLTESWRTVTGEYTTVDENTTAMTEGWYVVEGDVTISSRITISGTVHLLLCNGAELKASSGIQLTSGNTLCVYSQSDEKSEMGKLTATGAEKISGIGGSNKTSGGDVTIYGGIVNATSKKDAAGIGGGFFGSGGTVTIYGGEVSATGGSQGAGIGGGCFGSGGIVTIYGGVVSARGSNGGAGIGGGYDASGGTVIITGGNVKAVDGGGGAAAIGKGEGRGNRGSLKNADGQDISLMTITLEELKSETAIRELSGVTYGMQGVYTLDTNKLYVYLPAESSITQVTAENGQVFAPRNSGDTTLYCTHANVINDACAFCGTYLKSNEPVSENGIYQISTLEELVWFASHVNENTENASAGAKLMADIDVGKVTNVRIGTSDVKYAGVFDGNGHTLTIEWDSVKTYTAPFPYVNGATIKNLTVTGTIATNQKFAAGIVGMSDGTTTIENCLSDVTINSSVNGDGTHGGLVANVGSDTTTINNCGFTGAINGSQTTSCGGFVGWSNGTTNISNSFVAATFGIKSDGGCTFARNPGKVSLTNCYYLNALGTAQGTQKSAEQFASGEVAWLLNGSSAEGVWKQTLSSDDYPNFTGKMVYGGYINCKEMKFSNTELTGVYPQPPHKFDKGFCTVCGDYQSAVLNSNGSYEISNAGQLFWFAEYVNTGNNTANAVLTDDIDLENRAWTPIGRHSDSDSGNNLTYGGVFDGQYHVLHNLSVKVTNTYETGLFSRTSGATLKNFGVINATVENTNGIRAGVVGGEIYKSTVENVFTAGNITVTTSNNGGQAGGIAGECASSTLKNCITTYGMLCSAGTIENCYYMANETNKNSVGECVGEEVFRSGMLAWKLNGESSEGVWKQTIGSDDCPNFSGLTVHYDANSNPAYYNEKTISVEITWTDMEFTYTDGEWNPETHAYENAGWIAAEGAGVITAENTGNVTVDVSFGYVGTIDGISGSFTKDRMTLSQSESDTTQFKLAGQPNRDMKYEELGNITVTVQKHEE